jgi:hypothetical protein
MTKSKKIKKRHVHSVEDSVAHMLMSAGGDKDIPDLTVEVVASAMRYLKDNPQESIDSACEFGIGDWIK